MDKVAVLECLTEFHRRSLNIHVILVSLIYTDVIDLESCILEVCGIIRIARPVTAYGKVKLYEERLVERCGIRLLFAACCREPVVNRKYELIVCIESHLTGFPLDCPYMEVGREAAAVEVEDTLLFCMRLAVVDSRIGSSRIVAKNFHDIDLAALRPLTVERLILGHHPDRGPESLTFRDSCSDLYTSVLELCIVLRIHFARSVIRCAVSVLAKSTENEASVLNIDIVFGISIFLKLVIGPSGFAKLAVPDSLIKCIAVKLVSPEKVITFEFRGDWYMSIT